MTSASGELASDEESASDDVSFFWTSCLQNFFSSELQASFLLISLLSFVFQFLCFERDTKIFIYGPAHLNKY